MPTFPPETVVDLGSQLDTLLNKLDDEIPGVYSEGFRGQILTLILHTERVLTPDPSERKLIAVSKAFLNSGQANLALVKLEETIIPRLPRV